MIELLNMDCIEYMKTCKDNEFELAVCDPPYGIDVIRKVYEGRADYTTFKGNGVQKKGNFKVKDWDNERPTAEYFEQLFRVSKNQIIWGANNFTDLLPPSSSWIFWDKCTGGNDFSDGEFAFMSFGGRSRLFRYVWNGMLQGKSIDEGHIVQGNKSLCETKIHPTQKPRALYKWIYREFLKEGGKVLDTHLGSGSSAIAAYLFDCDFVGTEIDKEYFDKMMKRYKDETAQLKLI